MARKKTDSGPDMFGGVTAPPKPKAAPIIPQRTQVAKVSGLMAGLPAACERAKEALEDIRHRCESARAMAGILDAQQAVVVYSTEVQAKTCLAELAIIRKTADILSAHDAIGVEKSGEVELF